MSRFKRKLAPDALYKPGEILLFRRRGAKSYAYKVVFIVDVYKIKAIRYQVIEMQKWNPQQLWGPPSVEDLTEYRLTTQWGEKWEKVEYDLGFLVVNGSPVTLVEDLFKNDKLKKKRQKKLEAARKRVIALEQEIGIIDEAQALLEARYERTNP